MSAKADQSAKIGGRSLAEWISFVGLLVAISGAAYALYTYSVFRATEAMLAAAILFVAAAQIPGWLGTSSRRVRKPGELSDLIKANAVLSKDVQVLSQRFDTIASRPAAGNGQPDALAGQVDDLNARMRRLEEAFERGRPAPAIARHVGAAVPPPARPAPISHPGFDVVPTPSLVQGAFESGAFGLFLQPLVALTDKSTIAYEATIQLLGPNGKPFDQNSVSGIVRGKNLEIDLDRVLLEKVVRVATHFRNRGRDANVICRFSSRSFSDQAFLQNLLGQLTHRKDLAGAVFPAVSQGDLALLSTQALETLAGLNDQGYHFVMDDLRDLEAKPDILRRAGFGMVRADHHFFERAAPERDSECLALLARFRQEGVKVVANNLESEASIGALLNGVDAGQGPVFSMPRMVRAELADSGAGHVMAEAS